jgi:ketosteroid isomerase-like protein
MQIERDWIDAFVRSDTEALDRILADDFIFTDPAGNILTKAEWIDDMINGSLKFESIQIDDLKVRVFGDSAAVANGRTTVKAQSKEGGFNGKFCYTVMYLKRNGRWQAVAEQAALLSAV